MSSESQILPAFPLAGVRAVSLGRYLAALGVMRIAARRWPGVRGAWREGCLWVVGGPAGFDELANYVMKVEWSPYDRSWLEAQKDAEKKPPKGVPSPYALWLAKQDEDTAALALAHLVMGSTRYFNPLLGSGGNSGRRDFSKGWKEAAEAIRKPPKGWNEDDVRRELSGFLDGAGGPLRRTGSWNSASWFSEAYASNSGQGVDRGEQVPPWAMLLACEALPFFTGAPSRRLGAATRRLGAFPFIMASAAPKTAGEAGRDQAEVWTPLWSRPMTVPEVDALFRRGRAELGGRGAATPAAMAAAVVSRGVDAGVASFARHALGGTTSGNTFEPRYMGEIELITSGTERAAALSTPLSRIVSLCERLPRDLRKGKRWVFRGLRGPIEDAMVRYAASPTAHEAAARLLDTVAAAMDRVEANRSFREAAVELELLSPEWLDVWLGRDEPAAEVRLAMGVASLLDEPFIVHRWGVRRVPGPVPRYRFTKERQARCVWTVGPLTANLVRVLQRRFVDAGEAVAGPESLPTRATVPVRRGDLSSWLAGELDERELARWIDRFALFDWSSSPVTPRVAYVSAASAPHVDGLLALWGLFRPLLDRCRLSLLGKPLFEKHVDPRTVAAGRSVLARLTMRDVEGAVDLAASRYRMAGHPIGGLGATFAVDDPLRLASTLLFHPYGDELLEVTLRWLRPRRIEGGS